MALNPMTFIKASRRRPEIPSFTLDLAKRNAANGVMTVIIPDTNVMIDMECASAEQGDDLTAILERYQLHVLVDLLKGFEQEKIPFSFSPYLAFQEMDSAFTKQALRLYHQFGSRFGINWMDEPGLIRSDTKLGRPRLASWRSLGKDEQFFLSISHATLMLMHIVQRDGAEFSPIGKFKRFLREVVDRVGVLSTADLVAAKYVFAEAADLHPDVKPLCSTVRQNFGLLRGKRLPVSTAEMDEAALNAAFDLARVNFANLLDTHGSGGQRLDCWIATRDDKLVRFLEVCYHHDLGTGEAGYALVHTPHPAEAGYLAEASQLIDKLSKKRRAAGVSLPPREEMPGRCEAVLQLAEVGI